MATFDTPDDVGIDALLESSPEPAVHTSGAAEGAFLLALVALVGAPFSLTFGLSVVTGLAAVLLGGIGLAATSRRYVAGGALVPASLAMAVVALAIVGLRYLDIDTAFGDAWLPTITGWLEALNERVGG